MTLRHSRRRIRFIKRGLQTRLIASFVGLSALSLFVEIVLVASRMLALSEGLMVEGAIVRDALPRMVLEALGLSLLLLLPMTAVIGVLITFRTAGPLFRMERYLEALARGEDPGPCRLRQGDELQDFCEHLNQAVETLRKGSREPSTDRREQAA